MNMQGRQVRHSFQYLVHEWMQACFGDVIATDKVERNYRFLEEALELVQACGATADDAHQLVDYVFGRPKGIPTQELGGVMVTLAALANAHGYQMDTSGNEELASCWERIEQIREKQKHKPHRGPLPGATP